MIYTFYSYKGGVGRSMALANIAELFYQAGLSVLMVDWDLEAPGLERFFPKAYEAALEQPGLMDMLVDYKRIMATPGGLGQGVLPFVNLAPFTIEIYRPVDSRLERPRLSLMTAGRRDGPHFREYAENVLAFDWHEFYEEWAGETFFEWLRGQFYDLADVVLIDSRTGVTEMGGVCTYQLADMVVMFCAANEQNLAGTYDMASNFRDPSLSDYRHGRPLEILIVPARIDKDDSTLVDHFQSQFIERFKEFSLPDLGDNPRQFWNLNIPYVPKYAFKEAVAIREAGLASAENIVRAFIKLAKTMVSLAGEDGALSGFVDNIERLAAGEGIDTTESSSSHRLVVGDYVAGEKIAGRDVTFVYSSVPEAGQDVLQDPTARSYLTKLSRLLQQNFRRESLEELAGRLGLMYSELGGDSASARVWNLVLSSQWLGQIDDLVIEATKEEPNVAWPAVPDAISLAGLSPDELLAALPTDKVPNPRPLPANSRLPLAPNPKFTDRQEELSVLAGILHRETTPVGLAITGMGGVGKTQLAVEFAHRYGRFFAGGVYWLNFADPDGVPAEVVACGLAMNLRDDFDRLSLDQQLEDVRQAWQEAPPRLLIFDNCEDESLVPKWQPSSGGTRVLLTSRRPTWSTHLVTHTLTLDPLPRDDSVSLLKKYRKDLDPDMSAEIASELGDLPLALHLAGSFMKKYGRVIKPDQYLDQLRQTDLLAHPSLRGHGVSGSPTDHETNISRTIALSYDKLNAEDEIDAKALGLLRRAAHFAPGEPIPVRLLQDTLPPPGEDATMWSLQQVDALNRLEELGLLFMKGDGEKASVIMNRLVAAFVRQVAGESSQAQPAVEKTVLQSASAANNTGDPRQLRSWQAHLRHVAERAAENEHELAGPLLDELGYHLALVGDYEGGRRAAERAFHHSTSTYGPEDPAVATALNNLGRILGYLGYHEEAHKALAKGLALREQVFGPEHPDTASSLNELGKLLQDMHHYEEARMYLERALAIRKLALGPQHADTASSLNSLGELLQEQGQYAEARLYYDRALHICMEILGADHPETAQVLNNLGRLQQKMGDLRRAETFYTRALKAREKVLGIEHPETALSMNNVGFLLQEKGDSAAARPYFEKALSTLMRSLGEDHAATKIVYNHLQSLKG